MKGHVRSNEDDCADVDLSSTATLPVKEAIMNDIVQESDEHGLLWSMPTVRLVVVAHE